MFRILVTPAAKRQIKEIASWWLRNRPAAPLLFEEELAQARENLVLTPGMGTPFPIEELPGVRRLLPRHTRYYLYYTVDETRGVIHLRAIWHTSRGYGPWFR